MIILFILLKKPVVCNTELSINSFFVEKINILFLKTRAQNKNEFYCIVFLVDNIGINLRIFYLYPIQSFTL